MTWIATKKFFEKAYVWCVQHWRWLVFGLVALIAYLAGRRNARGLWQQAELARKQYKAEAAAIERAHADKSKKIKKAEAQAQKDLADAVREKNKLEKDLEAKKRREMMRLVKDQDEIDKALKDSGIDEV
jgi:Xaa-Pro aminopeptidase